MKVSLGFDEGAVFAHGVGMLHELVGAEDAVAVIAPREGEFVMRLAGGFDGGLPGIERALGEQAFEDIDGGFVGVLGLGDFLGDFLVLFATGEADAGGKSHQHGFLLEGCHRVVSLVFGSGRLLATIHLPSVQ